MRKISNFVLVTLLITLAGASAQAQNATNAQNAIAPPSAISSPVVATPVSSAASQAIISSLSTLPDADMLVYINSQRILNEIVPKFMPAKDLEEMRQGFEQAKQMAGIDPTKIDYIVIATRFRKPTDDLNFQPPEFMVVASGDFSAESLITLARMASGGKLRDEKYGTKTLGLMTIDPIVKESEKNPFLKSFTEVGIVSLNGNTIAAGTPGYLRAAIDAGDGKERISTEALNSLVRDPNVLISIAGTPWNSFAKSFGMLGTETNPRAARCESKIGDIYAALTMDATNFIIRGVTNADNPDTAKIFANLYSGLLRYATSSIPDPSAQSLLKGLAITAEGDEVLLRADVPQQMVIDLMQKQMKPKQDADRSLKPTDTRKIVRRPVTRRRSRRRG